MMKPIKLTLGGLAVVAVWVILCVLALGDIGPLWLLYALGTLFIIGLASTPFVEHYLERRRNAQYEIDLSMEECPVCGSLYGRDAAYAAFHFEPDCFFEIDGELVGPAIETVESDGRYLVICPTCSVQGLYDPRTTELTAVGAMPNVGNPEAVDSS